MQANTLSGPAAFLLKEKIQCACEGGRSCSKENPAKQRGGNVIHGIHGSWVGPEQMVLAMARPWQHCVQKHGLPAKFRELGFGMILNLQVCCGGRCFCGLCCLLGLSTRPELTFFCTSSCPNKPIDNAHYTMPSSALLYVSGDELCDAKQ